MGKSMYSLMLSDDVVLAVDKISHRMNTNRSALVNRILAEYVSLMTPEKRIEDIFNSIADILSGDDELVPYVTPNQKTMSVKSCLEYKYRPTVKYSVELYRIPEGAIGELTVSFRTQSQSLLSAMATFLRLWKRLEDVYISGYYGENKIKYELYDSKFIRSITVLKNRDYTNDEISRAISDYVSMFDTLMKGYIYGRINEREFEESYKAYLSRGIGLI